MRVGDRVHPGDVVAVVETHKGAIDVECFLDGVVESLVPLGQDLPVGAEMAQVRVAGEATGPAVGSGAAQPVATTSLAAPAALPPPAPATAPNVIPARGARARVTPAARRRAAELSIDADTLQSTASDGAVTWADVDHAAEQQPEKPAPQRLAKGGFDPAAMREAIVDRLALPELTLALRDLVQRARAGGLRSSEPHRLHQHRHQHGRAWR